MTCRKARKALPLLAGGDLAAKKASRLEAHVAFCPACRRELEELRTALGRARAAARAEKAVDWHEAEWKALMARITAERPATRTPAGGRRRWELAAGLATVVLAAGLAIVFRHSIFRPAHVPPAVESAAAKSVPGEPEEISRESLPAAPTRIDEKKFPAIKPEYYARNVDRSRTSPNQASVGKKGSSKTAAAEAGQDVLSVTMVSRETGLQVVWFFNKNFEWKGDLE